MVAGTAGASSAVAHWGCGNQFGCPVYQFTMAQNPPLTKWQSLINDQNEQLKGNMTKLRFSPVWTNMIVFSCPVLHIFTKKLIRGNCKKQMPMLFFELPSLHLASQGR